MYFNMCHINKQLVYLYILSLQGDNPHVISVMIDGEARYGCSLCGTSYNQKFNAQSHIRAKHSGRKFKCPYCAYISGWKHCIKNHIETVHKLSTNK